MMKSYRDLKVWEKAMDLVVMCYQAAKTFPKNEIYGLTSQLQRSAVSIPANIAEGHQRKYSKEFLQYLSIAYGSLAELETHVLIAERLRYIDKNQSKGLLDQTAELGKMINGLKRSVEKRLHSDL